MKSLYRELMRHLIFTKNFIKFSLVLRFTWLEWTLPFKIIEVLMGITIWIIMSSIVKAPLFQQHGGVALFIILGLSVNQLLTHSLIAYRLALMRMLRGRIGFFAQSLSMIDHMMIHGIPITAGILGFVLDGYLEQTIILTLYLAIGYLMGLRFVPNADYILAFISIVLGILATSGIGLISASTTILLKSWKGKEPIQWFLALLSNLLSGVYFPVEALPINLRNLAYLLPQTYVLKLVRESLLLSTRDYYMIDFSIMVLATYSIISLSVGILSLELALSKLRKEPLIE